MLLGSDNTQKFSISSQNIKWLTHVSLKWIILKELKKKSLVISYDGKLLMDQLDKVEFET